MSAAACVGCGDDVAVARCCPLCGAVLCPSCAGSAGAYCCAPAGEGVSDDGAGICFWDDDGVWRVAVP
jgi:hypothetical protein